MVVLGVHGALPPRRGTADGKGRRGRRWWYFPTVRALILLLLCTLGVLHRGPATESGWRAQRACVGACPPPVSVVPYGEPDSLMLAPARACTVARTARTRRGTDASSDVAVLDARTMAMVEPRSHLSPSLLGLDSMSTAGPHGPPANRDPPELRATA